MNKHISSSPRAVATIAGYRRMCAELEVENRALKIQNLELRAQLYDRSAPTFNLFDGFDDAEVIAVSLRRSTGAVMAGPVRRSAWQ
jgi:hypothetical protein